MALQEFSRTIAQISSNAISWNHSVHAITCFH